MSNNLDLNRSLKLYILRPDGSMMYYAQYPHNDLPYLGWYCIKRDSDAFRGKNKLYTSSAEDFLHWLIRMNDTNSDLTWIPTYPEK